MAVHYRWLALLLFSSVALGQGAPSSQKGEPATRPVTVAQRAQRQDEDDIPAAKVPTSQVPPTAAVITVDGLCSSETATASRKTAAGSKSAGKPAGSPASAGCKTVITRAQFERLADALNPQMPAPVKRQLAEAYPRLLLFAQKARQMGLDKDPKFQEMMRFATLQLLAQNLTRDLQKKASDISDTEVQKYYNDNPTRFQQVELLRIFIPKAKQHVAEPGSTTEPKVDAAADEAAMKAAADKIHSEAVAGGDFQQLQKEAFEAAGIKSESPNVNLGKITREGLPTNHQKVFELDAGKTSELIADPGGYYIYKVVSKELMPLSQAKTQIHNFLQSERMQTQMQSLINSVKPQLNEAYFAPTVGGRRPAAPSAPPQPNQPEMKPPAPPSQK